MARKVNVLHSGQSAVSAGAIVGSASWVENGGAGLVATGNNQATALTLSADINHIGTTASGTGVILPAVDSMPGDGIFVFNGGANTLAVYPDSGSSINGGSANASINLATLKAAEFRRTSPTNWSYVVSS
jgi:hypothetical protein